MQFDPENKVVQLCAEGMSLEATGKPGDAIKLFMNAWNIASTNEEKFIAAHYVARHQTSVKDKLHWDEIALEFALEAGEEYKSQLPSLYLNIAKCFEDIGEYKTAEHNYKYALSYTKFLLNDGYGNMIKAGIENGLERVKDAMNAE